MAQNLNTVSITGNITRDLDDKSFGYVGNGTARANVSIAVNRNKKNADGSWGSEVSYFDVVIWGKSAENLKPYLTKGKEIAVSGYLKQDRWEKDGKKNSKISIVAESIELLSKSNYDRPQNNAPVTSSEPAPSYENNGNRFEEDIPF